MHGPKLDRSLEEAARFLAEIPAAVALFDRQLRYVAASPEWVAAFALEQVALSGRRHDEICRVGRAALERVQRRALSGESIDDCPIAERAATHAAGRAFFGARPHRRDGAVAGAIVSLRGMDRPGLAEAMRAAPDGVTGLAGRDEFAARLRQVLADPDPERRTTVAVAIALGGFRGINSLHGFATGDQVLRVTAERLQAGTRSRCAGEEDQNPRSADLVARLGAAEFGLICGSPALLQTEAEALAERLLRLLQSPIAIEDRVLRLSASIGFVMMTPAHRNEDDVLRDLDLALQQAQAAGPGKAVAWEPALTRMATRRYTLAEELHRAFDNGEFTLHYQPVVRLDDNRMVGAEALLRWNHPSEGLAPSAAFVPVLEENGLIVEVGCWALRETVRQIESWRMLYGRDIVGWVSVNLSARQFNDPAALLTTLRGVHEGGFSVHQLKLEITETALMQRPDVARAVLAELRGLGIRVAIDDFGTGYAALNSLRHYAVDTIKIDGEFVAQIGTPEGDKLVPALLDIARLYGAMVIAEGIETAAQREFLRRSGCGFGQGYFFAEPMDGALLGAYALTHAVGADHGPRLAG